MFSKKVLVSAFCFGLVGCATNSNIEKTTAMKVVDKSSDASLKHATISYGFTEDELSNYNQVTEEHSYDKAETFNKTSEEKKAEKAEEKKKLAEPTKFTVKAFIADNDDCRINYVSTADGRTSTELANASFDAYLRDNVLYTVDCLGTSSNIDYKLNITADTGQKYRQVGSYSYYESTLKP